MVACLEKHKGPVRGLDFSEFRPHMLATGADDGEVIVWDLKNPAMPAGCCQLKVHKAFAPTPPHGHTSPTLAGWRKVKYLTYPGIHNILTFEHPLLIMGSQLCGTWIIRGQ